MLRFMSLARVFSRAGVGVTAPEITVEVHVGGEVSGPEGWVMDFSDIKSIFKPIYEQLDHNYLNDIEGLENPTSENLAVWIWIKLKPKLPVLTKIVLNVTCNSGCVYSGE